ncbi:MAG: BON domain-containing protein [Gemmataceae bacterium]|nr:BON domain-containing protein [Gemmataceae bacterium]
MVFKPQTFHEIPPQSEMDDPTEAVLESDIAAALARAGFIDSSRISVAVTGDRVVLSGDVGSEAEIAAATEVARAVEGVGAVENRLAVQRGTT